MLPQHDKFLHRRRQARKHRGWYTLQEGLSNLHRYQAQYSVARLRRRHLPYLQNEL